MNDIGTNDVNVEIRDPRFRRCRRRCGRVRDGSPPASCSPRGRCGTPRDQYLLFSDMPGDHLRRWTAQGGVTTFRKPCDQSNGLAWDRQGRLIVCEHATSHVTRTEPDGRITVLASH